jgi:hypothetical protein
VRAFLADEIENMLNSTQKLLVDVSAFNRMMGSVPFNYTAAKHDQQACPFSPSCV